LQKFDHGIKLSTWIYRVALNTSISFKKKKYKSAKHEYLSDSLIIVDYHEHQQVVDEQVAKLYNFINSLGDLEKALMLLYLD
jgi:RNA polymerase sigma-70 factor (ECF subfamily)